MAIGSRGQFYLIAMVFVISVAIGIAYFTAESRQLEVQSEIGADASLQSLMASYESELRAGLDGGYYIDNDYFYSTVEQELKDGAVKKGHSLTIDCVRNEINETASTLECNLTLVAGNSVLERGFSYTYSVPFGITLYADGNLTDATDYFSLGDTVYYRITTTNNSNSVDMGVYYPNATLQQSKTDTPSNYSATGSFSIAETDPEGEWSIELNNSEALASRSFFVDIASVSIETFDANNNPQTVFNKGDLVKYTVRVDPPSGVYVSTMVNGKARDYSWKSPSAPHESNLTISVSEAHGTMTIFATELKHYTTNSTNITILERPYGRFLELLLAYNFPHSDAFAEACGYVDWYGENRTYHTAIPFSVENGTGNAVVRVDGPVQEINVPRVYASKVHIIASRCDTC